MPPSAPLLTRPSRATLVLTVVGALFMSLVVALSR